MNGLTCPVSGCTVRMRELLFCAPTARMAWFESVAKSRPPSKPFSNALSVAGPCGWRPAPLVVGLARGPRIRFPLWSNTRMSGVKGLVADNSPPTRVLVSSLHRLGRPCPDSSTNTSKRCLLPGNEPAVGKFRPLLRTETSKPGGTTMSWPCPGSKNTVSAGQTGLDASARAATGATAMPARSSAAATASFPPRRSALRAELQRETRVEYCLDETITFIKPPWGLVPPAGPRESVAQVKWKIDLVYLQEKPRSARFSS